MRRLLQTNKKPRQIPRLQVALDFEILEDALAISKEVAPFVDILEAGTPLIKSEGMQTIRALKDAHPDKLICADLKTADAGYLEVSMAAKAKADIVTILADAYDITIEEALRASHEFHVEIIADLIVSRSPSKRLIELINLNYNGTRIHYALVHSGLDVQASRRAPLIELESLTHIQNHPRLAVAGGIRDTDISRLLAFPLDIIIVGGAITRAKNPGIAAEKFQKSILRLKTFSRQL
ncbi:MAG: orotidine 5'-phosphate decarboxylase [Candidatus Lokiarchaeota archaeon]|nr:orotidine 5'-phosphate decarboxylase [Candidatus Lokiarchaeota archaeon]